ncbi:MAG: NAD(+)/NADH kinase [Solobacterium sp.]|nr:NAD(+)/NADH kinase [Solobacterium sp.]
MGVKYTIIARPDKVSEKLMSDMEQELQAAGYERDDGHADYGFIIGGDGTFIYAVHHWFYRLKEMQLYGIHTGTLGFYTDYKDSDYREFMDRFFAGDLDEVMYPLLHVDVKGMMVHHAINEVRIENPARTQKIDVYVDGEYFETFRGTGLLLCTQLGSTAYNRSIGGAVIQEGLNLIEMAEIAGIHHAKARSLYAPIILKDSVHIVWKSDSFNGALLGTDSAVYPLDGATEIEIYICDEEWVRMLRGRKVSYFDRLKSLF